MTKPNDILIRTLMKLNTILLSINTGGDLVLQLVVTCNQTAPPPAVLCYANTLRKVFVVADLPIYSF